jgi:tetratricopeptide (TPR) repeat protein
VTSVIEKLRKIGDLHRLRTAVRRSPTPAAFAELAERYISLGKVRDARRAARRGLDLFPMSERLQSVCTFVRKDGLKEEITRLKREAAEKATPAVFVRLAQCYLELGDHERTLAVCNECSERYPLNENPYLVAGEVRTGRFFMHLAGSDGIEGEALLRRALRLNSQNLKARLLLAQLYYAIGALSALDQELAEIRRQSPNFRHLDEFRAQMEAQEEEETGTPGPSMAERIREIESRGEFIHPPRQFPANALTNPAAMSRAETHLRTGSVTRHTEDLATGRGIFCATAVDTDGNALAAAGGGGPIGAEDFPLIVTELLDTASDATRRMEFGALDWCAVEGDFGGIAFCDGKGASLAVGYDLPIRTRAARQLLSEYAARSFASGGEDLHE